MLCEDGRPVGYTRADGMYQHIAAQTGSYGWDILKEWGRNG